MGATEGAEQMRAIAIQLKELGDRKLKLEFGKALTAAAEPLRVKLPVSARHTLPSRGGLAEWVASAKIRISRMQTGRVRVSARQRYQIQTMDSPGIVRHPVFKRKGEEGRRTVWQSQKITPGWFSRPAEETRPVAEANMLRAAERMAAKIDGMRN